MSTTLSKPGKVELEIGDLADLRNDLVQEKRRLERLLARVDNVLRQTEEAKERFADGGDSMAAPRPSPLDQLSRIF
jgi:molecular chaperone GrpE (heat shock protein)